MTAVGPIDTSLEVAKNWKHIKAVIGIKVKRRTDAVDEDTNKGRVEAILRRKSGNLEGRFRMNDVERTRKDGLQSHKTCFAGPRPTRLWRG